MRCNSRWTVAVCLAVLAGWLLLRPAPGLSAAPPGETEMDPPIPEEITISDWIVLGPLPSWGRRPFGPSPVAREMLLTGEAEAPVEGDKVAWPGGGEIPWRKLEGDATGALRNGYAFTTVKSPGPARAILEGKGTSVAWINGDPVVGDIYHKGRLRVPVHLEEGENRILARAVRGGLSLRLVPPEGAIEFNQKDFTVPQHRRGEALDSWGAAPVMNTTGMWISGAVLEVAPGGHFKKTTVPLAPLPPLGINKVPFRLLCPGGSHPVEEKEKALPVTLRVRWPGGTAEAAITVGLAGPGETITETYISSVDGSVQHYAVKPPPEVDPDFRYAAVLTLHGAGVGARGQANSYLPKRWGYVVAPTNRRPFGFDWEDWGRIDALETLAAVRDRYGIDPNRVYLSGHSMGGHGAWHVGVTHPGLFAGVAPSAGWISFWSYAGGNLKRTGDLVEAMLWRATSTSDTLSLVRNLEGLPVFIIHGEKDDNVPAAQAREMVKHLEEFHEDFVYREFPGQGHWWGLADTPGTDCVDLAELWEYLYPKKRDPLPGAVSFRTMDPSTSHRRAWVEVLSQVRWNELSVVDAKVSAADWKIEVTTENIAALGLALKGLLPRGKVKIGIDGDTVETEWSGEGRVALVRDGEKGWRIGPPPGGEAGKGPARSGPFKKIFGHRFLMIVGTGGTEEENRAALRRARLDAQTWWYRANGRADTIRDVDFDPKAHKGRNWIFYGHGGMNRALRHYADALPVRPEKGAVVVGDRRIEGSGLACLAIGPNPADPEALIGVVGGCDAAGITLSGTTSVIRSGIGYPDFCVWSEAVLEKGLGGILALGFLDSHWRFDPGNTVLREPGPTRKPPEEGKKEGVKEY